MELTISSVALAVLACVLAACYFCRSLGFFQGTGIPYRTPLPIVGNIGRSFLRLVHFNDLLQAAYNMNPEAKYYGLFVMHVPLICIRDRELIKSIAVKNFDSFPNHRGGLDSELDKLMSSNLIALRGQRWREVRALLSPFFTVMRIKLMFKLMTACARDFADFVAQVPAEKRDMDTFDLFSRYANDVIASCAFGVKVDSLRDPDNEFFRYGNELRNFGLKMALKAIMLQITPRLSKLLGIRIIRKEMDDFFQSLVKDIVETRERTGATRPDMIQMMMDSRGKEDREDLSVQDMTAQAFFFFFAGFSTVSNSMCFTVHLIAVNPHVQSRLQEEIDDVLRAGSGEATYEAINEMKYLEAVINESMRMYPVAIVTDRTCEKDFELPPPLPGGKPYVIKPGTTLWFPIYPMQRDPKYFEEPDVFRPERFLEEGKRIQGSVDFIPFGIGPRMCIGNRFAMLEMKVLCFYLLARCNLTACPKTNVSLKLSKSKAFEPEGGFWLRVEPRTDSLLTPNSGQD